MSFFLTNIGFLNSFLVGEVYAQSADCNCTTPGSGAVEVDLAAPAGEFGTGGIANPSVFNCTCEGGTYESEPFDPAQSCGVDPGGTGDPTAA